MSKKKYLDDWSGGALKRKEFRHTHNGPEVPRHIGKKKNTRKWCKGKVGREHVWSRTAYLTIKWLNKSYYCWHCEGCGKQLHGNHP